MKVMITVTVTEEREVTPEDYGLKANASKEDLIAAIEESVEDNTEEFCSENGASIDVKEITEEIKNDHQDL
jgi:hypothetical protein